MKFEKIHLLCLSILFLCASWTQSPTNHLSPAAGKREVNDRELKAFFSKMIFVKGEELIVGQTATEGLGRSASDSTLFCSFSSKKMTVKSFYISATEVTNGEWRAFYQEKKDELGPISAKNRYYPDTSRWEKDQPYSFMEPMTKNYFQNPAFSDYPVVGVSWDQVNDYCNWKSQKLQKILEKEGIASLVKFRLPTEAEWECAAINMEDHKKRETKTVYPWPSSKGVFQINKLANIGRIIDQSFVLIKEYADDGAIFTAKAASYPPNHRGIYDLAGNVAEWTSDEGAISAPRFKSKEEIRLRNPAEVEKEMEYLKANFKEDEHLLEVLMKNLQHDKNILTNNPTKICKGGSWKDGLVYAQIGSREGINKELTSSKIGFRIAISDVNEDLKKYFPKKNWTPRND